MNDTVATVSPDRRVWKRAGTATTTYPSRYYDLLTTTGTTTATSTAYLFKGSDLFASITGNGNATTTSYIHPDHLGGTNAVTNGSGTVVHTLDYYPYGTERITSGTNQNNRHYIGEMYDSESSLSYLNARYYEGSRGQFLSQDPVHLAIGNPGAVQQLSGQPFKKYLSDPQQLNSYSYAKNNPIVNKDPTGNATYIWNNGAGMTGLDTWNTNTYYQSGDQAMLSANASFGEANRLNLGTFYNQVKPGGPWDYKRNSENRGYYFFNGQLVSAEEFGNLNYGYSGTAFGIGKDVLTDAAGAAQIATAGRDNRGPTLRNISGNFDDPRDTANIRIGASTYNNASRPNSSSGYAAGSNTAYNATIRDVSRIISAISALVKAFSK